MSMFVKKSFTPRSIQDYLKAKDQDIKINSKDIKIQDHKHAKGTTKEFPRIQGSKIHDVTRSEAHDTLLVYDLNNKTFKINDLKAQLQDNDIAIRVIPATSFSTPQLKSTQMKDRVMQSISQVKKMEVEDHHRNFKFSNNKASITACNDSLNAKTSNVNFVYVTCGKYVFNKNYDSCVLHYITGVKSRTKKPIAVPISTREPKRTVNQFVATHHKKIVDSESTIQKPRSRLRMLYENVSKTCKWWYTKLTPPAYKWEPKSKTGNVNTNVSLPIGTESRSTNISEPTSVRGSNLSNTPLSLNSLEAHRNHLVHRRLWVHKAHDRKSQASK
ncbi:hypothetical protein Tco_0010957 [Tanacetum coccineum]